jgi:hypothetical protein
MPQPKRLIYPTQLIDREATMLQRDLRRIYHLYRVHHQNKLHCLGDGEAAIKAAYQKMQGNIKVWCSKHGLVFDGDFSELDQGLNETLTSWRKIVEHF